MKDRIMHALDSVRLKSNAAAVVLCELSPNHETAFVLAIAPRGLMAQGMPFPAQADPAPRLESDPLQLSQVLPVALRLALSAPASHAWTQSLQGTRLQITLAWSQPPHPQVLHTLAPLIDAQLRSSAIDFALRQQLSFENARLQTVLGALQQAVVTIDSLRQEASVNRAAQRLLGLSANTVSATVMAQALQHWQAAALNQEQVIEVARQLARQPGATVTDVVWRFAQNPTHVRVTTVALDNAGASGRVWVFDDISAQMAALHAAEQAQARYRLLAENADDIVFRESPDRTFEWVSDSVTAVLGWSAQEMVGQSPAAFVHPEDKTRIFMPVPQQLKQAAVNKDRWVYQARYRCKDGSHRWLEVSIRTVRDASGAVSAWVGSCRDVQRQVQTQQALALSQGRLRASLDGMLDPQVLLAPVRDPGGTIVDFIYLEVNRATTQYLAMPAQTLIGSSVLHTMQGLKDSGLFALYVQAMHSDAPLVADDFLYDNEVLGLVRRYDIRGTRVGDELTITWRDTTERFEAKERIAQSEQHFRLLAENSADVVLLVRDGRIDWASPSMARTLNWQPTQWLGKSYLDFIHPQDRRLAMETLSTLQTSGARVLRLRLRALSGQFHWAEVHVDVYIGADGVQEGVVASFRTIDAEVAAEAAIARLARFDTLTGLANRREALDCFTQRQSQKRQAGGGSAVLFCDVDRFKSINDSYGHAAGDEVLRALAHRIRASVRSDDICARMGGDELLVILDSIHTLEQAGDLAEHIRRAAERPIPLDESEVHTSLSIGVALAKPGEAFEQVTARADAAMYEAKKKGRNQVVLVG